VGADALPNLSLPRTILSGVDNLIGAGGVIQTSPNNLTLYNSAVAFRLLGGTMPHDELLGPNRMVLSPWSFWGVETQIASAWVPMLPRASNFTLQGTNTTGTFVTRTMLVGNGAFNGTFTIVYKATSSGPLKWDLSFAPSSLGRYRLVYAWQNISDSYQLAASSRRFQVAYASANFTFLWNDVPARFNTTSAMSMGRFALAIDLGSLSLGDNEEVDPNIVGSSASAQATSYSFQRKVFFEPNGGYYFVLYDNGSGLVYRSSPDGAKWSSTQATPLLPATGWGGPVDSSTVFVSGRTVVIARGENNTSIFVSAGTALYASVHYVVGTISGPNISWSSLSTAATVGFIPCSLNNCGPVFWGIRYVSIGASANGTLVFAYNWSEYYGPYSGTSCPSRFFSESALYASFIGEPSNIVSPSRDSQLYGGGCYRYDLNDHMRSVVITSNGPGGVRVIGQMPTHTYSSDNSQVTGTSISLNEAWFDGRLWTSQLIEGNTLNSHDGVGTPEFSAATDANLGAHVIYRMPDGTVSYAYSAVQATSWTKFGDIFSGSASSPSITVDYSTNNVYAFAIRNSSMIMRSKTPFQIWNDGSIIDVVTRRTSPTSLTSNYASASDTNSSQILLVWTEGSSSPYNVTFASIPIQTVWSPYSDPSDPWDGNGIVPYGQYFANLGEYVSPSTGMLVIRQTDLSVPGRGLDLDLARIYTEPYSFLGGTTYNYEAYPWAQLGYGWQLNFPWMMNKLSHPSYIHLWDGEGYRIPSSFWTTGLFENHQGEHFRLIENATGIFLLTKSGESYKFDTATYALVRIADPIGNNITLNYASGRISSITDTMGRNVLFCYTGNFLTSIQQSGSSCGAGYVRRILYTNNGQSLTNVTDVDNRVTSYSYGSNPWLLTRITFPTGWYDSYTYATTTLGTQALSYRVFQQMVNTTQGVPIRRFDYSYTQGAGDQVIASTVKTFNGTQLASFTDYSYSFAGVTWNVSDANHTLTRGVQQRFGVHGEIPREIMLVTDGQGHVGSYSNYYRYDLWGNQIYSRRAINPAANWYHETFSDYYNNGLPVGFYSFAETISQANHAQTDNNWNITSGQWTVVNGEYMLTGEKGNQSLIEVPQGDAAFQMTVRWLAGQYFEGYMGFRYQTNGNHYEVYLSAYDNTLRFVKVIGGTYTRLQAVTVTPSKNVHYTIRVESSGYTHTVYLNGTLEFQVTDQDGSMLTGRYLALGTYSSTSPSNAEQIGFSNIYVQPLPSTFSNSFFSTIPYSSVHGAVAGIAQLQNGTGTLPVETYFSYNSWGGLVQQKQRYDSSPGVTQWLTMGWSYDGFGNPTTSSDPRGYVTYYSYSAKYGSAFLTNETQVGSSGKVTHLYGYDNSTGAMLWAKDPNLNNVTYKYDILNRLVNVTYPNRDFKAYSYNDQANYAEITNENGWKTRQIYDGLGRQSITDHFLGGASYSNGTYTYNWQDKETSSRDPLRNLYNYTYDPLGRLILTVKPDGNTTRIAYDDLDSWVVSTDESGNSRCGRTDFLGRLISVIEYSDNICTPRVLSNSTYVANYYYDGIGNLARVSNAIGKSTSYVRDNLNRLTKTTYADGSFESYTYDNNGNILVKTDRSGAQTSYAYDSLNRVTSMTYASMGQNTYTYDSNSNLSQLNSQNTTLTYAYDSRNRVTSESYSVNPTLGGSVAYGTLITLTNRTSVPVQNLRVGISLLSYDTAANQYAVSTIIQLNIVYTSNMLVIRTQDPMPLRVDNATAQRLYVKTATGFTGWLSVTMLRPRDYLYNALDQRWTMVTSIELAPSGIHIMYDIYTTAPGNYIANGYLDPHKNGPTGPSSGAISNSYSVSYTYNGEVLSTITYPDGFVAKYSYDSLVRVLNVTKSGTTTYYARFTYYKNDELRGVQYGNGLLANYTYNKLGLVARETLNNTSTSPPAPLLILNYQYNKTAAVASVVGNSTTTTGSLFTLKEQYKYDPLHRLNNSYLKSGATLNTISYSYDNLGDRISQMVNGVPSAYVYNPTNNELTNILGSWSYSYDGNGNLRAKTQGTTTWAYTWDSANRLVKASSNNVLQGAYAYDGIGRRVESVESSTTFYAYYGTETLSELISGGATTDYLYAGGLRIGRLSGATVNYYHADALGSTRLVTSATKTAQFSDNYQPFGEDNGTPYCSGSCEKYKFTGKPVSASTGLYYYYHRWYDPSLGRFISPDSKQGKLSYPQSLNLYIYVLNRPTSLTDPSGEWGWNPFEAASNWWNGLSSDQRQFIVEAVVAVAVVAVVVATGGAALPVVLAAGVAGGAINVGITAGTKLATGQSITASDLGHSFLQGFIVGAATAGIAGGISALRAGGEAADLAEFSAARGGVTYKASQYLLSKGLTRIESAFGTDSGGALSLLKDTIESGSMTPESSVEGRITIRSLVDMGIWKGGLRTPFAVLEPDTGEIVNFYPRPLTRSILDFLGLDLG